jgi:hypothetical protein
VDGNFIRSFFNLYYRVAAFVAGAATLSYAFSGCPWFAMGAAVIAVLSMVLRRTIIAKMDLLQSQIQSQIQTANFEAIPEFRKIHVRAVLISLVQLVVVVWSLFSFKL